MKAKGIQYATVFWMCMLTSGLIQARTVTISGRVVDVTASPVADASLSLYEVHYAYGEGRILWTSLLKEASDARGNFSLRFESDHDNDFMLIAHKNGLSLNWQRIRRRDNISSCLLRLSRPAILAGRIVDTNDRSVPHARLHVCLAREDYRYGGESLPEPEDWLWTSSDETGRFSFRNLPEDATVDLWVEAPGKAGHWTFWQRDSSVGNGFKVGTQDIKIALSDEACIRGKVIDESSGQGIAGVALLARSEEGVANYYTRYRTVSGSKGEFELGGLPADDYSLQVTAPYEGITEWVGRDQKVSVKAGQIVSDVNVAVSHGCILDVIVTDASSDDPVVGVGVNVSQQANFGRHTCFYQDIETDENGRAAFRVPAGTCTVSGWGNHYNYYRDPEPVQARQGKTYTKTIKLDQKTSTTGTITDQQGRPLANVMVTSKPTCEQSDQTDTQGRFEIMWRDDPGARATKRCVLAQDAAHNRAVLVEMSTELSFMKIGLLPAYTVQGKVTDPLTRGLPAVTVQLKASMPGWSTHAGQAVYTDQQGRFEISALPHQTDYFKYEIEVKAPGYGPIEIDSLPNTKDPNRPIAVPTIVLQAADQSIAGIVIDANDQAMPGLELFISGPRGSRTAGQPRKQGITDEQGRFLIEGLCPGPLRIQAGIGGRERKPGFLEAQGGDTGLKVVMGQTRVHERYTSLVGKPMPALSDLRVDLGEAKLDKKPVLLCFWDMEQRPSRRVVTQLAKQAQTLSDEGVTVVLVQVAEIEQPALKQWIIKHEIPFKSTSLKADFEEKKLEWDVKSLPWLILADEKHIVRAEGFAFSELHSKLRQTKGD
jgi:hypothetical protein